MTIGYNAGAESHKLSIKDHLVDRFIENGHSKIDHKILYNVAHLIDSYLILEGSQC